MEEAIRPMVDAINTDCMEKERLENHAEDSVQSEDGGMTSEKHSMLGSKRRRDTDEEENWTTVGRYGKKHRTTGDASSEYVEAIITSNVELPKQFAFARMMKDNNIQDILQVKYINAYKIKIRFMNEGNFKKLLLSEMITTKGWKIYKTSDVGFSYGVVRRVELELSEEDILKSIDSNVEILSVKRLMRRSSEGLGWTASECVKLCFKGSSLPSYVAVHGIRVKVDPYIFPVTQCSNCWKFGHMKKMCPRKICVCPKCGKNHQNCETTKFVCVNCTGDHLALSKKCPVYLKERKIRNLMADFNCTYQKAQSIYVPEETPPQAQDRTYTHPFGSQTNLDKYPRLGHNATEEEYNNTVQPTQSFKTYASILALSSTRENQSIEPQDNYDAVSPTKKKRSKNKSRREIHIHSNNSATSDRDCSNMDTDDEASSAKNTIGKEGKRKKSKKNFGNQKESDFSFNSLLESLRDILFFRKYDSLSDKFISVAKICVKWLVSFFMNYFNDLPFIKSLFGL